MRSRRRLYIAYGPSADNIPLRLYNIGTVHQKKIIRLDGFPVLHLFMNRSGSGSFQTLHNGKSWSLGEGQACFLPAAVPHTYAPDTDETWTHSFVTLTGPALDHLLETMSFPMMEAIPLQTAETLWPLFDRIYQLTRGTSPDKDWSISASLYELLLEVHKQSSFLPEEKPGAGGAAAVRTAAKMLREHYAEPVLLADYAQSLGYSVQHLNRLFRQTYGVTMHQYLDEVRFAKAQQLLRLDMTVQDIATALGMESNYFIRAFKRIHGMTPGQYKAMALAGGAE